MEVDSIHNTDLLLLRVLNFSNETQYHRYLYDWSIAGRHMGDTYIQKEKREKNGASDDPV